LSHTQVQWARGNSAQIASYTGPAGEIVVDTDDYSLILQDGMTAGGIARIRSAPGGTGYAYSAPGAGATVTAVAEERRRVIDPAGTLAALTVTLPPSPLDGDTYELMTSQALTALTVDAPGGASVNGGSSLLTANGGASWLYRAANTTWYRRF
jgi:hypothetical protein